MIEEVVSVDLAVHERLTVRKNRLAPKQLTGNEKRISIVTGRDWQPFAEEIFGF